MVLDVFASFTECQPMRLRVALTKFGSISDFSVRYTPCAVRESWRSELFDEWDWRYVLPLVGELRRIRYPCDFLRKGFVFFFLRYLHGIVMLHSDVFMHLVPISWLVYRYICQNIFIFNYITGFRILANRINNNEYNCDKHGKGHTETSSSCCAVFKIMKSLNDAHSYINVRYL